MRPLFKSILTHLKVNASFGLGFGLITVVNDGTFITIENEPALIPFRSKSHRT